MAARRTPRRTSSALRANRCSGSTVISTKNTGSPGASLRSNADELGGEQRAGVRAGREDEGHHRDLAAQVAQREALAVLVGERERRRRADLGQRLGARWLARKGEPRARPIWPVRAVRRPLASASAEEDSLSLDGRGRGEGEGELRATRMPHLQSLHALAPATVERRPAHRTFAARLRKCAGARDTPFRTPACDALGMAGSCVMPFALFLNWYEALLSLLALNKRRSGPA